MDKTKFMKTSIRRFSFRGLSIQQRLPLLICVLLLSIIVTFSWTSYIGVKRAALSTGRDRLHSLTGQLSSMFGQSAQALIAATRITAGNGSIMKYLQSGGKDSVSESLEVLQKIRPDSTWVLSELLDLNRVTVLRSGRTVTEITAALDSALSVSSVHPDSFKVGRIYMVKDSMYYPIIAGVTDKKQIIGYIVRWRLMQTTPKSIEQFSQLLGTNATLYIGNDDGSLWTDLIKPVSTPPVDTGQGHNFFEYSGSKGHRVIGAVQPIANTHWMVLVEFSQQTILEGANRFLRWIIIIGGILIAIGIFVAWVMSRNITRPLNKLTVAASAIADGDYSASVEVNRRDELGKLARSFNTMAVQVSQAQQNLEKKVQERTAQLEKANKELEAFSYSVSHDLRAPLRAISGFSTILKEDYSGQLDKEANRITDKIISNAKMMGQLIDDLISFSQIERKEIKHHTVDMKKLAESCLAELLQQEPENKYRLQIHPLPPCYGDESLIKQVWVNLLGNALKYSSKKSDPFIEIGSQEGPGMHRYFIRDNGVGFDMQYAHKLFGVFQRLHNQVEFEGTGVGLALAKRIINHHHGDIWAEGSPGKGATFYFSLPENNA